jgi:NADPH:quinone reductase-like Zn-dependent oxidoreductase
MANTGPRRMLRGWLSPPGQNKKVIFQLAAENLKDLAFLGNLIADGKIKPIIDKTFPLDQIPQAHAYVDSGEKKGCVVIDNTSITKT